MGVVTGTSGGYGQAARTRPRCCSSLLPGPVSDAYHRCRVETPVIQEVDAFLRSGEMSRHEGSGAAAPHEQHPAIQRGQLGPTVASMVGVDTVGVRYLL